MNPYAGDGDDPYLDPETGILKNLVGATTRETLDQVKSAYSGVRDLQLEQSPIVSSFDVAPIQSSRRKATLTRSPGDSNADATRDGD